jgi:hypothetical protein
MRKSADVSRRCHAVSSSASSAIDMPLVEFLSTVAPGGRDDEVEADVAEEADVAADEADALDVADEERERGVSLNWNVMLLFVSNHRGFGAGWRTDCLTD